MFGATVFTVFLGAGALAAERALTALGRPTRGVWAAALALGLAWPALAPLVLARTANESRPAIVILSDDLPSAGQVIAAQLPALSSGLAEWSSVLLVAAWLAVSGVLLLRLVAANRTLVRLQRSAREGEVDGEAVLVTSDVGPAVVGLVRPRIAVPAWLMELDAPLRALVLRHEREHCRTNDPRLVWLAAVSVALVPWNLGAWWIARRLRLAIEVDCDARTLGHDDARERYGKLLLLIAQRQSGVQLAPMLAESNSHLSQRITAMQATPARRPALRSFVFGVFAVAAVVVACSPRVNGDLTAPRPKASPTEVVSTAPTKVPSGVYFEFQVEKAVSQKANNTVQYPADLKAAKVEGEVLAQFVVDESGRAQPSTFKVLKSSHAQFAEAIRTALPTMEFNPALVGGRAVKQLVQQPFMFAISKDEATSTGPTPAGARTMELKDPKPLYEFKIQKMATLLPNVGAPRYPDALRSAGIEGEVSAQYVVDTLGMVDAGTLKILSSTDPAFTEAVRASLPSVRFSPAEVDGRKVKQLVSMPYVFRVSGSSLGSDKGDKAVVITVPRP
jgi:TonB family protein